MKHSEFISAGYAMLTGTAALNYIDSNLWEYDELSRPHCKLAIYTLMSGIMESSRLEVITRMQGHGANMVNPDPNMSNQQAQDILKVLQAAAKAYKFDDIARIETEHKEWLK